MLGGYVGTYRLDVEIKVTIARSADHLTVQVTGQPAFPIFPEGPRDFFLKVVDAQITFVADANGRATQLVLHQAGRDEPAKRIAPTP